MAKELKSSLKGLKRSRRKGIVLSSESMIKTRFLNDGDVMPLVIEPGMENVNLSRWLEGHRQEVEGYLHKHGALLFRGFDVNSIDGFEAVARAMSPDLLDYVERAAPRGEMGNQIFNSTEYPANQWIPLHHEMSYSHNWPTKLFFYCHTEPGERGYTPITNERETIKKIPDRIKDPFLQKGVMYVRNYGEGVDMPWQTVFQTDNKSEVEAQLDQSKTEYQWFGERLRTRARRQVVAEHPVTGDRVWFNHAHMFHISNMPDAVRKALLEEFSEEQLPRNSFYGDGSRIEDESAEFIRNLYRDTAITFPWKKGDVLLLDNFLTAHGRTPYSGPRQICVAMAELYTNPDFR